MNKRIWTAVLASVGVVGLLASYKLGRAFAAGIPQTNTLTYSGTLLNNGQPDNGQHFLVLKVFGTASDGGSTQPCQTSTPTVTVVNGRFTAALDPSCVAAVHQNSDLMIDVTVDGIDLGQTPFKAVPYAVEADTASNPAPDSKISNLAPPGSITAFGGPVDGSHPPPDGWLLCDGSSEQIAAYPNLFRAIGTSWGGDGSTTFNLPDLRGTFLRGFDQGNGKDPDAATRTAGIGSGAVVGDKVGTYEADQVKSHSHDVSDPGHAHGITNGGGCFYADGPWSPGQEGGGPGPSAGGSYAGSGCQYVASAVTNISVDRAGGTESRPLNAAVNYLIKY